MGSFMVGEGEDVKKSCDGRKSKKGEWLTCIMCVFKKLFTLLVTNRNIHEHTTFWWRTCLHCNKTRGKIGKGCSWYYVIYWCCLRWSKDRNERGRERERGMRPRSKERGCGEEWAEEKLEKKEEERFRWREERRKRERGVCIWFRLRHQTPLAHFPLYLSTLDPLSFQRKSRKNFPRIIINVFFSSPFCFPFPCPPVAFGYCYQGARKRA